MFSVRYILEAFLVQVTVRLHNMKSLAPYPRENEIIVLKGIKRRDKEL